MCGIAGLIDPKANTADRIAAVERMCSAMIHRGPDDSGIESKGPATLGMRRLAIFDPANGHQPMVSPDGRYTLIFNGALYNFKALRVELGNAWTFRTECDTEVLLAAFIRWGMGCVDRFRGMFAFAVWDAQDNSLHLARDPFGIKPLYYHHSGNRLIFASELNALDAAGIVNLTIDARSVVDYLGWFAVPAPRTIYQKVFALRAGDCATLRNGELTVRPTWTFSGISASIPRASNRNEFIRELRSHLEDSIRAHVVADVPVGAFLSGGLDSAVVAGLMTQVTGARLRTFSIGFEESAYSEATDAAATARHFGADHHAHTVTGADVAADVDRFIASCDQPTGDGLNTYYVSEAARAGGVTVALSGLGGDELFGGYPSFRNLPRLSACVRAWRVIPRPIRDRLLQQMRRQDTRWQKMADFLQYARNQNQIAAMQRRVFAEPQQRALLEAEIRDSIPDFVPFHPQLEVLEHDLLGSNSAEIASAWELRTYMVDALLRDSDVMSMRHSLELRVPFVDRPLIEWLWRQKPAFRFTPDRPKDMLAAALADLLPPGLRERRKRGFSLPMDIWMRQQLRPFLDEVFSDSSVSKSGLFDRGAVQMYWRNFLAQSDTRRWARVWSLGVLIAFVNRRPGAVAIRTKNAAPAVDLSNSPFVSGSESAVDAVPRHQARSTLLMVPEIFGTAGGIQRILQLYLKAFAELGSGPQPDIRIVSLHDMVLDPAEIERRTGVRVSACAACGHDKRRFLKEAIRIGRGCERIISGHVAQLPVAWVLRRLNSQAHYYLVAHGIEVWRPFTIPEKIALKRVSQVFCVSEFTRQEMMLYAPTPPERMLVLPNGLDPAFNIAQGRPIAECPPVVLTVTRLTHSDRYKGVEELIQAMPLVRKEEPNAVLRIIGRGDDAARLQAVAKRLGVLGAGVEFLGYVEDGRLANELRTCRLFAMPSMKEGFGLVFLEAMAHGRPCLGARAASTPEVITAETGVLVEPGDQRSVANGILGALRHPWRQEDMLERARGFSYTAFKRRLTLLLDQEPRN